MLQVWEWWFLEFDLPLRTHGPPMWPHVPWQPLCPPGAASRHPYAFTPSSSLPTHGPCNDGVDNGKQWKKMVTDRVVCLACVLLVCFFA